jgi:hypothetical protein
VRAVPFRYPIWNSRVSTKSLSGGGEQSQGIQRGQGKQRFVGRGDNQERQLGPATLFVPGAGSDEGKIRSGGKGTSRASIMSGTMR